MTTTVEYFDLILLPIMGVILSAGLFGNLLLFISLSRFNLSSKQANFFLRCQAIFDAFVCLITFILLYQPPLWATGLPNIDLIICYLWHSQVPLWFFVFVSVQTLVCVAIDRFCAVCYPVRYKTLKSYVGWVCLGGILLYGCVYVSFLGVLVDFQNSKCIYRDFSREDILSRMLFAYSMGWGCTVYFIPMIIFGIVYGRVAYVLIYSRRQVGNSSSSTSGNSTEGSGRAIIQLTKAVIIVTLMFALLNSLDCFYTLLSNTNLQPDGYFTNVIFYKISTFLIAINSCINILVYVIYLQSFRRMIVMTLRCQSNRDLANHSQMTESRN